MALQQDPFNNFSKVGWSDKNSGVSFSWTITATPGMVGKNMTTVIEVEEKEWFRHVEVCKDAGQFTYEKEIESLRKVLKELSIKPDKDKTEFKIKVTVTWEGDDPDDNPLPGTGEVFIIWTDGPKPEYDYFPIHAFPNASNFWTRYDELYKDWLLFGVEASWAYGLYICVSENGFVSTFDQLFKTYGIAKPIQTSSADGFGSLALAENFAAQVNAVTQKDYEVAVANASPHYKPSPPLVLYAGSVIPSGGGPTKPPKPKEGWDFNWKSETWKVKNDPKTHQPAKGDHVSDYTSGDLKQKPPAILNCTINIKTGEATYSDNGTRGTSDGSGGSSG